VTSAVAAIGTTGVGGGTKRLGGAAALALVACFLAGCSSLGSMGTTEIGRAHV
jgi:hypothetical protein